MMSSAILDVSSAFEHYYSKFIGLPDDQWNFVLCQLIALLLGFPFRTLLSDQRVSPLLRHVVEIGVGVSMAYFCFGSGMGHLVGQSMVCYGLMLVLKAEHKGQVVLVASLGYLCILHMLRQYYDYGAYKMDVTGPLMVTTQRLSSLAFSLQDGAMTASGAALTPTRKHYAVRNPPSLIEFLSYIFCFHALMIGPFCFYKDYIAFIDGSQYTKKSWNNSANNNKEPARRPSPMGSMMASLVESGLCGLVMMYIVPIWRPAYLEEPGFLQECFAYRMFAITMVTTMSRFKYYFAWKFGEASNLSCGLGFNGYDTAGKAKWDLIRIVNIFGVELSLNLKMLLDNWNIATNTWLRYIVYERVPSATAVFMVSAFWHGFYPGYYIMFGTAALFTHVSRLMRRFLRERFQSSRALSLCYDGLTLVATRVLLGYLSFPFVLLNFWSSIAVFKSIGFWLHIVSFVVIVVLTFVIKPQRAARQNVKAA